MRLSQLIPTKGLAIISVSMSFLCIFFFNNNYSTILAITPFILMIINGIKISIINGLLLSFIWIIYVCIVVSPFILFLGYSKYLVMLIYLPIAVVFYKKPHHKSSFQFLLLQTVFWDIPLLFWINLMSILGGRALQPFYSEINNQLSVGSLPLTVDVPYLKDKGIGLVINMCREYKGPIDVYNNCDIVQYHIPTPDICEPDYLAILKGLLFIQDYKKKDQNKQRKIFIHCKAGRGRAATFALCYLIYNYDIDPKDAIELLKKKRSVVEAHVIDSVVVQRLIRDCLTYKKDINLIINTYN